MPDKQLSELIEFVEKKVEEGYSIKKIREFLIKQNFDTSLIENAIQSGTRSVSKQAPKRMVVYKILLLIIIPLALMLGTIFFLEGTKHLSFKTDQKISTSAEEECYRLLSELMKTHFGLSPGLTYEQFLNESSLTPQRRDFYNRISKETPSKILSFWRFYTFGNQTSLKILGIPRLSKNYMLHLDYNLDNKFIGCVTSRITPTEKYDLMSLNQIVNRYRLLSHDYQPVKTNFGEFDLYLRNKVYINREGEEVFYSFVISLRHQDAKKILKDKEMTLKMKKFLLEQKVKQYAFICGPLFLVITGMMYILNRFYFKLF